MKSPSTTLTLHCPEGHAVVPARLSVCEGLFYCPKWQKHDGHKAYYALRELHTLCCGCGFWTPPEGDCTSRNGHNVCAECAMEYLDTTPPTPCPSPEGIPTCGPAADCPHMEHGAGPPRPISGKS